jgi:hypothetical protein
MSNPISILKNNGHLKIKICFPVTKSNNTPTGIRVTVMGSRNRSSLAQDTNTGLTIGHINEQ